MDRAAGIGTAMWRSVALRAARARGDMAAERGNPREAMKPADPDRESSAEAKYLVVLDILRRVQVRRHCIHRVMATPRTTAGSSNGDETRAEDFVSHRGR